MLGANGDGWAGIVMLARQMIGWMRWDVAGWISSTSVDLYAAQDEIEQRLGRETEKVQR
ncbi:hypothetical protein [Phragmitibacter flavus]|uniref:hypothetical protein n=1 Tax=Phragmitibacter flavus TaxID=2576071 RepID=UPI00140B48D4|nr:hypothetical protein [Phragmitibacter flavus]